MKYKIIEKQAYTKSPIIFSLVEWSNVEVKTIKELLEQLGNISLIKQWCLTDTGVLYEVEQDNQKKYLWIEK